MSLVAVKSNGYSYISQLNDRSISHSTRMLSLSNCYHEYGLPVRVGVSGTVVISSDS